MANANFDRAERDYLTPPDFDSDDRDDIIEELELQVLGLEVDNEELKHELEQYKEMCSSLEEIKNIQEVHIKTYEQRIEEMKKSGARWLDYGTYWYNKYQAESAQLREFRRKHE